MMSAPLSISGGPFHLIFFFIIAEAVLYILENENYRQQKEKNIIFSSFRDYPVSTLVIVLPELFVCTYAPPRPAPHTHYKQNYTMPSIL